MKRFPFLVAICLTFTAWGQTYRDLASRADSAYNAKAFALAGPRYLTAAQRADFDFERRRLYYDAACCHALIGKTEDAFRYLSLAIRRYGYSRKDNLLADPDLISLHKDQRWKALVAAVKPAATFSGDPKQAKLVTTDVKNFWRAYDLAQRTAKGDTARRRQIYRDEYFAKASPGLQDYYAYKIGSIESFVRTHDQLPRFYAAIRPNTMQVEAMKAQMMQSFANFKDLYPNARFPPVYFVIGRFSSGGTASNNGLILGLDQDCRTPAIPTDELSLWQQNNFTDLNALPHVVAHELIHFQQAGLAADTTLLRAALVEGMADFLGELISGKVANPRLFTYAKGREGQIWSDFNGEMHLDRARNWIANSNQETADKPADLGYWVGYRICKAYYDHAADKKQAVYDMLNIKDYPAFLTKSRVEETLK